MQTKQSTMKKSFHKKNWNQVQMNVEPPPIMLIKCKNDKKYDKESVQINCIGTMMKLHKFIGINAYLAALLGAKAR